MATGNVDRKTIRNTPAAPSQSSRPRRGGATGSGGADHASISVDGVTFRRGAKVRLRPGFGAAPQDGVWAGRMATIERIYRDYEDGVHLAVTVDDDPGQELMRDIGRYLYFKPAEVEVVPA